MGGGGWGGGRLLLAINVCTFKIETNMFSFSKKIILFITFLLLFLAFY